jgi:3-hydroxyisobutyrate dehydrogenase-like beta-hydroxyacid dehydrogenase
MKVGFIGAGNMGGPMCRNIIKNSGHEILVHDRDAAAVQRCVDVGGTGVGSIAAAVGESDVVFTSLPMPRDVEAVALGEGGIGESARQGTVHIDLSTNSPTMVRSIAARLAPKGVKMLDAPVSGGTTGAEKATIAIMVGGDRAVFDEHRALFESFGKNVIYAGALGAGSIAKIVNNMVAFCNMASGAEGLMLGAAAGIDPDVLNQVIRSSSGDGFGFRSVARKALQGDWSPTFALDLAYKDLHLALELADEIGIPLPLAVQTHNLMRMARGSGYGGDDTTAMMRVYEDTLKREVRGKPREG